MLTYSNVHVYLKNYWWCVQRGTASLGKTEDLLASLFLSPTKRERVQKGQAWIFLTVILVSKGPQLHLLNQCWCHSSESG